MSIQEPMPCQSVPGAVRPTIFTTDHEQPQQVDDDNIPNIINRLPQVGTKIVYIPNCSHSIRVDEVSPQHPKSLFVHASSSNFYCDDVVREEHAAQNACCSERTQKRHEEISREFEMNESQFLDSALPPLLYHNLNETNSPFLTQIVRFDGKRKESEREQTSSNDQNSRNHHHYNLTPGENSTAHSYHDQYMPCIIGRNTKPYEVYNTQEGLDLKGYPHCLNHEKGFPLPKTELASTIIEIESTRHRSPLYKLVPQTSATSLKPELLNAIENMHSGGDTKQSPLDLGIAINDTLCSLRPQRPPPDNSCNMSGKQHPFIHQQQMQKHQQQQPESGRRVGAGDGSLGASHGTSNHSPPSLNNCCYSSPQYHNNHNPYNNPMMIPQQQPIHTRTYRNSISSSVPHEYSPQSNIYRHNSSSPPSPISSTTQVREEPPNSASSLLLQHQQAITCTSRSDIAPIIHGGNERILPSNSTPMQCHSNGIPHSSSSSSLQGAKKQRMAPPITTSTNFTNFSSVMTMNTNQSIPTSNNSINSTTNNTTTKPQTNNIKFHLLDDPNLKQDEHRSNFVRIDEEQIRKVFHLTQRQAAAFLGVSLSTLKRRFYEMRESLGMDKWPTTGNGTTTILPSNNNNSSNTISNTTINVSSSNMMNIAPSPTTPNPSLNTPTPRQAMGFASLRKNSYTSDQSNCTLPSTPQAINDTTHQFSSSIPSRRPSIASQEEVYVQSQSLTTPNNSLTTFTNQYSHNNPYIMTSQNTDSPTTVNTTLSLRKNSYTSDQSTPATPNTPQQYRPPSNDSIENFLSRYTPKSFDDVAQDCDTSCLPNPFKRRTNVYGQGHDPILIAKMFSDDPTPVNPRKRSYPNIDPVEMKEIDGFPRHSSFSSQGSIDGSFEPLRKVSKQFPVNKRGSTDENADPKSNMSFILNDGIKDPTHLDKEEWNTLMEAFKKQ